MSEFVRFVMDSRASQFLVHAFASGLVAAAVHNPKFAIRDFDGDAKFIPENIGEASLRVAIRSSSLDLADEVSSDDRRAIERTLFQEVLEANQYPEITFDSAEITMVRLSENLFRATVAGKLTLHGVTKRHKFPAQIVIGEDTLRAYGDFVVKQTDFGMQIASVAGGTLKIKDEVRLSFFIIARKQR